MTGVFAVEVLHGLIILERMRRERLGDVDGSLLAQITADDEPARAAPRVSEDVVSPINLPQQERPRDLDRSDARGPALPLGRAFSTARSGPEEAAMPFWPGRHDGPLCRSVEAGQSAYHQPWHRAC